MKNNSASYDELLAALGDSLGMKLIFDNDVCSLDVEGRWSFSIRKIEAEGRIVLMGGVADEMPEEMSYDLVLDILDAGMNPLLHTGPAIARDPKSGMLVAWVSVDIEEIEPADMGRLVSEFLLFQASYTERLAGLGRPAPEDASASFPFPGIRA